MFLQNWEIKVDDLKKLTTADAEKKLREMGFTTFKYDTLEAGRADLDGKIGVKKKILANV